MIKRDGGSDLALQTSKIFLIQPHADSQAAYETFHEKMDHGDLAIRESQQWLAEHYKNSSPVETAEELSRLVPRTFKRRFKKATGLTPIEYVQKLRIEKAKTYLEKSTDSVDDISWKVGYEDPAFFRRLFKRTTSLTPSHYRRKFKLT